MPQFILTPWRDISELIKARSQLYPTSSSSTDERRRAIDLVGRPADGVLIHGKKVWPLIRENDHPSNFVTGFVDTGQVTKVRRSMYKVAEEIGLPASFVELRHQVAHEELPSVSVLRQATRRSLVWLWDYFWKHIDERIPGDPDEKKPDVFVSGLEDQFREILRPYVKRRVQDVRDGRGKAGKASMAKEDVITDITCKACVRACRGDAQTISVLVNVLLEPKFLIPANRTLQTSLTPAFNIWTPLLRSLSTHQQDFLSTLVDELLIQLTLPSNLDVTFDTYREAVYLWLIYLLTDEVWTSARKRSSPDMDCVVATCLMGQNVWSLRLVEKLVCTDVLGDECGDLRGNWGELVECALGELDGGRRGEGRAEMDVEEEEDLGMRRSRMDVDVAGGRAGLDESVKINDDGPGWRMWKGPWIPKPIGMI